MLRDYIEERKRNGWAPKKNEYIFIPEASTSKRERLDPGSVWLVVKSCAEKAGLDPTTVWPHSLRKSFRKVLNSAPAIPEDLKETLMGHRLPGSRGNYFDFHDTDDAAEKYGMADWSRNNNSNGKLRSLEEANKNLETRLAFLERRNKELMIYTLADKAGIIPLASIEQLQRIPTEELDRAIEELAHRDQETMKRSGNNSFPEAILGRSAGKQAGKRHIGPKTITSQTLSAGSDS